MYKHIDSWEALSQRLAHPLDYLFKLVDDEHLLLFMPYVVMHERTKVICRLIEPKTLGIKHEWCKKFVTANANKIKLALNNGRAKEKLEGNTTEVAHIFKVIDDFDKKREDEYKIQYFRRSYAEIRSKNPDPQGFEWGGLDNTYPIALLAKTDAGEAGRLCSLVITLVYNKRVKPQLKNLTFVKTYLTSLAKYKINVTKVTKNLGDLDAREWNDFRSCFNNNQNFGKYAFHHITHGGDVKKSTFTWDQVQIELKDVVKNLLINASYPTVSTCVCKTSNVSCDDKVLGHPKGKPSVRELLQWNYRGQSLTRVLLLSKPKSISVLGQLNHDYCWFNPLCIEELVQRIDESDIHADECASYIPNSGKLQGVYAFEEDSERNERNERKGLWLCTHIPGLLTPTKWGEIGGFGEVMKLARRSGAKNVYRIDWDASSKKRKIWRIVESGTPSWVQEVVDVQAEFGDIVKHLLPQSGLVLFIPAAETKDERKCWEVSID